MDYSNFSVEEFANDDYFIRWVNEKDHEAEKFWDLFLLLHPELEPRMQQARMLVLNLKFQPLHPATADHQVDIIWDKLEERIENSSAIPVRKLDFFRVPLGIAASLAVIALICGGVYFSSRDFTGEDKNFAESVRAVTTDFIEEVNTGEKAVQIHLSDGTIVFLEKNSRLRYRKVYDGQASRDVFLAGQAFFKVTKRPNQPFFVHANEVITKVLGTSFSIKAYREDKDITVTVTSGKVSVFSPKKTPAANGDQVKVDGVVLLPNQQVVYQREEKSFEKTLVKTPVVLLPSVTDNSFAFDNAPIADVFHLLENAYGVDIIFDEEVMKNCLITAPLGSEPLFDKLRIICRTIGADYEVIDTNVVINSSGCQ